MRTGDGQACLSSMLGLCGDTVQQQWAAGNGLEMLVWLRESHKQVPSVVDEGHHARHESVAHQILCGETTVESVAECSWNSQLGRFDAIQAPACIQRHTVHPQRSPFGQNGDGDVKISALVSASKLTRSTP